MNIVLREEKKFLITLLDSSRLASKLQSTLSPDEHNTANGYSVRSLYFDTLDDKDYHDKVDGFELRRKIRLRVYDAQSDFAMLEMKQKEGAFQKKRSLRLKRIDAEQLALGNSTPLLQYPDPFAAECFALIQRFVYRPKTIVEYRRQAFQAKENHIRITLDSDIIATETNLNLFDPHPNMTPVRDPFNAVLEVKFNGFLLSYIKDILQMTNRSEISVSKYCLARGFTHEYHL